MALLKQICQTNKNGTTLKQIKAYHLINMFTLACHPKTHPYIPLEFVINENLYENKNSLIFIGKNKK